MTLKELNSSNNIRTISLFSGAGTTKAKTVKITIKET